MDNENAKQDLDVIYEKINSVLKELNNNEFFRTKIDINNGIIKIYSSDTNEIKTAESGISEILDMAYSSVEHHPYWMVLYHSAEIIKSILDVWDSKLTKDQISEISWRIDEIRSSLERMIY